MAVATGMVAPLGMRAGAVSGHHSSGDSDRLSRLVLARMKTLEEGFASVVHEMRVLQQQRASALPSAAHSLAGDLREERKGVLSPGQSKRVKTALGRLGSGVQRRPSSRQSLVEGKVGLGQEAHQETRSKWKGKEIMQSDADDSEDEGQGRWLQRRGSSF